MKKRIVSSLLLVMFAMTAFAAFPSKLAPSIIPNADAILMLNGIDSNNSPAGQELLKLGKELQQDPMFKNDINGAQEQLDKYYKILGFTQETPYNLTFALAFNNADFNSDDEAKIINAIDWSAAFQTPVAITRDQIKACVKLFLEEQDAKEEEYDLETSNFEGCPAVILTIKEEGVPEGLKKIVVFLVADGKVAVLANAKNAKAIAQRYASNTPAQLDSFFAGLKSDGYIAARMFKQLEELCNTFLTEEEGEEPDPFTQIAKSVKGLAIECSITDAVTITLRGLFESAEKAQVAKTTLWDAQIKPLIAAFAPQAKQFLGQKFDLATAASCKLADKQLAINLSMTPADIRTLIQQGKAYLMMMQQQGAANAGDEE